MKKLWKITGTDLFSDVKTDLKAERDRLNIEALKLTADQKLSDVPPKERPFKLTKGPDHPKVSPFFSEVRIGTHLEYGNKHYQKTDRDSAKLIETGVTLPFAGHVQVSVFG